MRRSLLVALCFGLSALISAPLAFANGVFQSVTGDVRAAMDAAAPASVGINQRIVAGTTVTTGPGAQTVIRFDDGHTVVLNENTEFRVNEYRFDKGWPDNPQSDSIAFQILKGAMRSVTGLIGSRSRNAFALLAPQATIGIRGTDFMIALVNPAYLSVLQGSIGVSNAAGSATFAAGATATVATSTTLAVGISAADLPASVATAFGNLSSVAISAAGAGAATGAASGGITAGMVAAGVAVVAIVAAAASSNSSNNPQNTTTTTTTTP